jgi:hypothetical protein
MKCNSSFVKYTEFTAICELVAFTHDDFASILQKTLQDQWDQCKEAMKMFPYFSAWSDAAVKECCILSKIDRYELDQTILGNSTGAGFQTTCELRSPQ